MSTASTTLQQRLLSATPAWRAVLLPGDTMGLQRARHPPELPNPSLLPALLVALRAQDAAAGAQEMPPHGLQKWSWLGGRCLNSGDVQPPLCPSQSFWNCIIWASCSFPFRPPSFPEEVKHKQTLRASQGLVSPAAVALERGGSASSAGCCCSLMCTDPGAGCHCSPQNFPLPLLFCVPASQKTHCLEPVLYF